MVLRTHAIKTIKEITRKVEQEGPIAAINAHAANVTKDVFTNKNQQKKNNNINNIKKQIKKVIKRGQKLGEASGNIIALPLHILFGRGGITAKNGYSRSAWDRLLDRGLLGYTFYYLSQGIGITAQAVGYSAGFLIGVATLPLKPNLKEERLRWIESNAKRLGYLASDVTGNAMGGTTAFMANLCRIPSAAIVSIGKGTGNLFGQGAGIIIKARKSKLIKYT